MKILLCTLIFLFYFPGIGTTDDKLLTQSDFTYIGSFRVPDSMGGELHSGIDYGGEVIAFNPLNNSLYILGNDQNQNVVEIGIPIVKNIYNIKQSDISVEDLSYLNYATVLQTKQEITEGRRSFVKIGIPPSRTASETDNSTKIGGLLVWGNKLLGTVYNYYDGGYNAVFSHFKSGMTLNSTGDFEGLYELGPLTYSYPSIALSGQTAGCMAAIPTNWQTALGGKVLSGLSGVSVFDRTSGGTSAFAFDPDALGATTQCTGIGTGNQLEHGNTYTQAPPKNLCNGSPMTSNMGSCCYDPENVNVSMTHNSLLATPSIGLVNYPGGHRTLGNYYTAGTIFDPTTTQKGLAFPAGSQTLVSTGKHGTGVPCYGTGTTNYELDQTFVNGVDGEKYCYDPSNTDHGMHAYPYQVNVWLYDAADLQAAKEGHIVTQADYDAGRFKYSLNPDGPDGTNPYPPSVPQDITLAVGQTVMPWNVIPYEIFQLPLPWKQRYYNISSGAAAYDDSTGKLYISEVMVDGDAGQMPIINVFQLSISSPPVSTGITITAGGTGLLGTGGATLIRAQ